MSWGRAAIGRPYGGRIFCVFAMMTAAFLVLLFLNIKVGSVQISVSETLRILMGEGQDLTQASIILKIRLPRLLMAMLLGGALALSGYLLQSFFGNPIAGPFVLGISSGAKMIVALCMIFLMGRFRAVSSYALIGAAFIGSLISMGFVLMLSRQMKHMAMLLVSGIMIGYICSAVTDFLVTFADDADIVNLHGWSQGRFSGMSGDNVAAALIVVGMASILAFLMAKPIGAYQMGEVYAKSVGVNIGLFRAALILISSILSATVTAFAGPISFVGIAVPHLVKSMMRTARPIVVMPAVFLGGAVFCLLADLIARTVFAPMELSISTVTSILGAPVVIMMLISRQKQVGA